MKRLIILFFVFIMLGCNTGCTTVNPNNPNISNSDLSIEKQQEDAIFSKKILGTTETAKTIEAPKVVKNIITNNEEESASFDENSITETAPVNPTTQKETVQYNNLSENEKIEVVKPTIKASVIRKPLLNDPSTKLSTSKEVEKLTKVIIKTSQSLSSKSSIHPAEAMANFDFNKHLLFLVQKDARDDRDYNMLMLAAERGYTHVVQQVLEINSQAGFVNQVSSDSKKTALLNAVDSGYVDIVKLLLINNADKEIKNKDNKNALELAKIRHSGSSGKKQENYKEIIAILQGTQRY